MVTAIATFLSTIIGVTSAYVGGITDRFLTVVVDVFLILPVLPLLILLAAYLPPGVTSLTIVLCITSWAFQARQLRSQGLSIRNRDFLLAARARGERGIYIILVEIVPTMTSLIAASFLSLAVYVVGFAASLQFLGLGNSSELMWGTMLYNAQAASALEAGNAWWALAPGAAVAIMGTGLRARQLRLRRDRQSGPAAGEEGGVAEPLLEVDDLSRRLPDRRGRRARGESRQLRAWSRESSWGSSASPAAGSRRCCSRWLSSSLRPARWRADTSSSAGGTWCDSVARSSGTCAGATTRS